MFDLNEGEVLAKIQQYQLIRRKQKRRFHIDVFHVIAGEHTARFIAAPKTSQGYSVEEYWGRGDTELDALQDCLSLIKYVSVDEIAPLPTTKKHATTAMISRKLIR